MKKFSVLIFIMILVSTIKIGAQEDPGTIKKNPLRAESIIEAGYLWNFVDFKKKDTTINKLAAVYYSLLSFRDRVVSLGMTAGFEYEKNVCFIPITTEGRFNLFPKNEFQPSILVGWGYSIYMKRGDLEEWLNPQFSLGLGIKGKLNKTKSFTFTIGYRLLPYDYDYDYYFNFRNNNYLFVKAGIIFLHKKRKKETEEEEPFLFYH